MWSRLESLPLVLVEPLHHHVEHVIGPEFDAVTLTQCVGELPLVQCLDAAERLPELGILGVGLELAEPLQVGHPVRADHA